MPPRWTGIGLSEEVQGTTRRFSTRGAIFGTFRSVDGKTKLSLELLNRDGPGFSGFWIMDVPAGGEKAVAQRIAHELYATFDAKKTDESAPEDPAVTNEIERGYMQAGRSLLDRRNIPDMDRAIVCFEGATKAAPRSVDAWSYLALAYMGRNYLTRDQAYIDRALRAAHEAVRLSPQDSAANRSLGSLQVAAGDYPQALDYELRSLQAAHPSARAFGQIGYIWKMTGRPDKAVSWYHKAKLSGQLTEYDELLGDCWSDLGDDARAATAYDAAARFRPDLPEGWLGLCRLKILQGDLPGARELFDSRAAEYGQFHAAKIMRAQIEFFARNFPAAEKLYEDLQAEDQEGNGCQQYGVVRYRSALARIKAERGDPAAGDLVARNLKSEKEDLEKAPKNPEALYAVAAAHAVADEKQESLQFLRAAADAGWCDHRSARTDPRFDAIKDSPDFDTILTTLAARLRTLRAAMDAGADGTAE